MNDDEVNVDGMLIDEMRIRRWFMLVKLEQARDTMNIVRGIVDGRVMQQPKRKRRSDAGQPKESKPQGLKFPLQDAEIDEECR